MSPKSDDRKRQLHFIRDGSSHLLPYKLKRESAEKVQRCYWPLHLLNSFRDCVNQGRGWLAL
uniref:Uncharacterized protein n=1 Tax=Anguilla anguilla TaxID=7936 RepID=A0A0E9PJ49_ANGAN